MLCPREQMSQWVGGKIRNWRLVSPPFKIRKWPVGDRWNLISCKSGAVIDCHPGATHVGLYIGQGCIVHALDQGIPVQVVSVDPAPIHGARRY